MACIPPIEPNLRDGRADPQKARSPPCIFPTLNGDIQGKAHRKIRCIPTEHLTDINTLNGRDNSRLMSILIAAWSIVLHQFIGSEVLYFGVNTTGEISGSILGDTQIFAVVMDPECPIEKLLQHCISVGTGKTGDVQLNTGVILVNEDSQSVLEPEMPSGLFRAKDNQQEYDMLLIAKACKRTVEILLEYNTAIVSDQQVGIIGGVVSRAIGSLFEFPTRKLKDIDLLDPQSKGSIAGWNKKADITCCSSIVEIIQEKSRYQPGAQAVCSWDGSLTYVELEVASTRLALYLKEKGVGPEVMVPICFEKTIWAIVATLAVLKAGAAFVPIDPSHPLERLKQIITQVNAKLVLLSDRHAALLEGVSDNAIAVSGPMAARLPTVNQIALPPPSLQHVAYVLFTSGSTGSPKGCVVDHRALAAVADHGEALRIGTGTRVLQFASLSFAVSLVEIFCTLTSGGTICIPSDHERLNDLPGAVHRMDVDWAFLTPSLINSVGPDNIKALKTLAVTGEPLGMDLAQSCARMIRLVPAYGMTEWAGVCTLQRELNPAAANPRNIGKSPSANLWLVNPDNHGVLAPVGAVGELLIEGPGLAQGYLDDTERTAMVFIENPPWLRHFDTGRQARMYKTGDLVRYSPDGSLIYIGRKGVQAKIRGQRIELGEVEHHVYRQFPGATKVIVDVVVPRGDNPSPLLVAFICSKDGQMSQNEDAHCPSTPIFDGFDRDFQSRSANADSKICDHLPDYMIPHIYIPLKYVPLTITGKVNRRKLKEVAGSLTYETLASYAHTRSELVDPSSGAEQRLHRLLSDTLKLPSKSFGVNDSFFRLGGDSLKVIQLVTRCRAEGISITVQDVFREQTVRSLALLAAEHDATMAGPGEGPEAEFSLSPFQQSMILAGEQERSWYSPTACIFLWLSKRVDPAHLENAIRQVVSRHPMLRAKFKRHQNDAWTQYVPTIACEPQEGYECARYTVSTMEEASKIMKARQESLDIEKGPVFVTVLLNLGESQYLALAAHTLVVDHTSWKIILRDIEDFLDLDARIHTPKPQPLCFLEWCCSEFEARHGQHMIPAPITPTAISDQQPSPQTDDVLPARNHSIMPMNIPVPSCLLGDATKALRLSPSVVLQAVALHAFSRAFEDRELPLLTVEEDGRGLTSSHGDFSQTVGQFTTHLTLCVQSYGRLSFGEVLRQTKESYQQARNRKAMHLIPSSDQQSPPGKSVCAPLPRILFRFRLPSHEQQWSCAVFGQVAEEHLACLPDPQPAEGIIVTVSETANCPGLVLSDTSGTISCTDLERWVRECRRSINEAVKTLEEKTPIFTPCDLPLLALTGEDLQDLLHCRLPGIDIYPSDVEAAYPCSPIQQGMLISRARRPEHYQALCIWEVMSGGGRKTVRPDQLQSAWRQLTRRHSILRTIFVEQVGTSPYIQVVLKADAARTAVLRCADGDDARATLHADRQIGRQGRQSLPRFTICQTERGKLLVAVEISHMLMDATSMEILKRDLALACDGKLPSTHGAPYSDYVAYIKGSGDTATLGYWSNYVAECSPCYFPRLNDGLNPANLAAQPQSVAVPFESMSELNAFCRATGLTISNVVQVAWGLVLRAFTGLDSVLFGYTTSGRDTPVADIEDAVGPYINMLVCRIDFYRSATLLETVHKAQRDFTQAVSSQHLSLTELFHSARDGGRSMFNTCMTFLPEIHESELHDESIHFQELESILLDEYDIKVECRATDGCFTGSLVYSSSTLSRGQATRIAHNLSTAIATILQQSGLQADTPLLSDLDTRQLEQWNGTVPARVERCVHDLIAERCRAQPDAAAVCAWDGDFTYGELDRLSSALAAHLVRLGVGPEVFVPLLFEKSRWTTVAMLGVMKAGGAFVLLDPSHPQARLQGICQAMSAGVIVASSANTTFAAELAAHMVIVEAGETSWRADSCHWAHSPVTHNNAVYAVFTSGSTGTPKGAIVTHAGYCTATLSQIPLLRVSQRSRVLQFSSHAFDVSIYDHLTTIVVGGCVCIPSETERKADVALAIVKYRVDFCLLTPSVLSLLHPGQVAILETLAFAGEPISSTTVRRLGASVPLINAYGPAECTVTNIRQRVRPEDPQNIGHATGCVCWVVDLQDHTRLLPIGAVGELLIEGPIVGRGYLNDPEKTAAAFIDPPAWLREFRAAHPGNPGGDRVYKTGDLVQYTVDGSLRFLGRKDTQVKLRGQRIELGEVEHHVRECFAGARDVVAEVVTPAEDGRPPMLVAFVWVERDHDGDGVDDILIPPSDTFSTAIPRAEVRLHDAVPAYMVPAVFLPLVAVPLTATGKTDRRRLRERAAALSRAEIEAYSVAVGAKRAPATAAERTLQRLWARVLDVSPDTIGADDNFFRLGGDSITAMQLAAAAREDGFALSVADVFQHPKLCSLAACVDSMSHSVAADYTPFSLVSQDGSRDEVLQIAVAQCKVPQAQIADIYPCTALQEGLMALTMKTVGTYVAHFSYTVSSKVNLDQLCAAWNAVARANPILQTRIIQSDTLGTFQVVIQADMEWAIYDSAGALPARASMSFGIGEPLVRATVIQAYHQGTSHQLILSMHHAAYDAWSLPLLLGQAEAALRGESLRPRPLSAFIAYLVQSKDAAESFWRTELAGIEAAPFPTLPAPSYVPKPSASVTHTILLSRDVAADFTMSTMLRLGWALSLSQYTSTGDVVFGLTVTGRGAPVAGIEQMTGPTIATIPLRVRLDADITVAEALQQVQDHSALLLPYEQTGLQNIRRLSDEAAAACDFQNLLVIQSSQTKASGSLFTGDKVTAKQGAFTTYALTLLCELVPGSVSVEATYDPKVIGEPEVQRLLFQLAHVTQEIQRHPGRQIREVTSLSPEDRAQLQGWNGMVPQRVERCVHELIAERCRAQPDAPAVCAWDGDFTYGELDRLSSALAAHLARLGVGPEVFVPLLFEKSRWTAVAMLGVMKAGGAFVLLDPAHPPAWLQGICRAVSASIIVASATQARIAEPWAVRVVAVRADERRWHSTSDACKWTVTPSTALYAVFTSGSTGVPKGTVITHSAYCTSAIMHSIAFGMSVDSRVFQFSSYAFDVSILEHLTALLVGGCICTPSDADRQNQIGAAARQLRVTWAELTPSTARILQLNEVATLETLVLIGEPVTSSDIHRWAGEIDLKNGYGPAECSAISTVQRNLGKPTDERNIGYGTGCVTWVVDRQDQEQLIPIGAVGELLIEGPIVGRGYLNDPEKTAAVFIDPPAWLREFRAAHPGSPGGDRVYKTGDLVQYAADGSLRFVGRKDTQVKLRGQRIELGEVEHHTRECFPGARDVVAEVVTPMQEGRVPILVAFVWVDSNTDGRADNILQPPTDTFRAAVPTAEARLHDAVPAYMVPAIFLPIAGVPLTATGKTDRRRLRERAAALSRAAITSYSVAAGAKRVPATAAERTLRQLWARVLNLPLEHIGADDSFFQLGGDSISAMQLSSLARVDGFTLSVPDIFHSKTIAALAPFVGMDRQTALDVEESVDVLFELSPIQRLFFQLAPNGASHFNQSFLVPLAASTAAQDVARAIPAIVDRHSMLRARFSQRSDGGWSQVIYTDIESSYRYHHSVLASLEEAKDLMHASQRSFDLQNGPLFSVDLIDISTGQEQYIFLAAHHLVIDLVSWRIILADLEGLLQNGQISGPKTLPFQEWCQLQAEYTRDHLGPAESLPFTLPRAASDYWGSVDHLNMWENVTHGSFTISEEVTAILFRNANDALQTHPVEIFLAALWHAFVRTFRDRPPPAIYNEGHGREPWDPAIDLSRTVGWFTTMWPLCMAMNGDNGSIVDVVRRSKDARRRTPSNGWAYFASRFLNPDGQQAFGMHGPVEVLFNYQGLYQQFEREGAVIGSPITLEDRAPDVAGDVPRFALIDVSAGVERGRLLFSFSYNRHMRHQDGIRQWITQCERSLQEAAEQLAHMGRRFTLCDFPLLPLTYDTLDVFMEKIGSQMSYREVEDAYPCSPVQLGILISQTRNAQLYQTTFIWKVVSPRAPQPVDLGRLRRAWQQVVDRHAILRTVFVDSASQSAHVDQVVRTSAVADIELVEGTTGEEPVAAIKEHLRTAGRDEHSLHRLVLYAAPAETFCALDINHALIDAQSMRLLQRDLQRAYDGHLPAGRATPYSSYISYLQGLSGSDAEAYWKSYMDGVEPCLFPTLCDENIGEEATVRTISANLGSGSELHEFCRRHEVTLPNVFQAAWGIVLHAYTGSDSVCFGYLSSGRDIAVPGIDDIVGPFINVMVCRMQISSNSDSPVLSLVQANQDQYLENLPYQHFSLADVLHLTGAAGQPLFNTSMSVQRVSSDEEEETGIQLKMVGGYDPTEYDISVTVAIAEERVEVYVNYRTTTLDDQQANTIAHAFKQVVSEIAQRPYDATKRLNVVGEGDKQRLEQWNGTVPARVERCVHDLIAERCRAQPDAAAVCAWDGDFTYGELDRLSSALAAHLAGLGVGPEVFVPLLFEKSRWTTVTMLGVMKAGGAFVLLDPAHPRARLETICQAVSAGIILTSASQAAIAERFGKQVLTVGTDDATWYKEECINWVQPSVASDHALYIVFTSGSTGEPKGAVISHSAFSTSAKSHSRAYGLSTTSRVFQFSSYAFDANILESLTTLLSGGCICVPSDEDRRTRIVEVAAQLRVTWAELTPSTARILQLSEVATLKTLVLIGEPVISSDIHRWAGEIDLKNGYGPAECSAISAVQRNLGKPTDERNIGYGTGCVTWVVDRQDQEQLIPIGAVGELLIEGPIVGRGYLNDPEKTAAVFIDPPAWLREFRAAHPGNPGGDRVYKTGDLVQYMADGSLRFVGRKDTQVKLRGQRIELGEVEYHTRACFPGARDVVAEVVTPAEDERPPILVAFVWVEHDHDDDGVDDILIPPSDIFSTAIPRAEMRLHDAVPAYMVPAVFLPLVAVPLTATGKTDRRRLRERAAALSRAEIEAYSVAVGAKRAPATVAERTLQRLWAQVLNLSPEAIGADDSFFRLGGDSLAAMHVATLSRSAGISISVADIFTHRNLSTIIRNLSRQDTHETPLIIQPLSLVDQNISFQDLASSCHLILPENISDVVPATNAQVWFLTHWCSPLFSFRLSGELATGRLQHALKRLVQKHAVLRTVFHEFNNTILQVVLENSLPCFEHIRTDESLESVLSDLCDRESKKMSMSTQPFKVFLISRACKEHVLVIRLSHAQYDGYSIAPLLQDLASAYNEDPSQDSTVTSFSDYIYYCRQRQSKDAIDFWREHLQGSRITIVPFPPANPSDDVISIRESASKRLSSLPQDTTYPVLVNACVSLILSKLVASDDVVFGLVVNTRSLPMQGIDSIVGPCINLLPFRVSLQQSQSVGNLCMGVREQYAKVSQHCHLELADIAGLSNGWPTDGATLPFGCIVNHINANETSEPMSLEGLSCSSFSTAAHIILQDQVLIRSIIHDETICIEVLTSAGAKTRAWSKNFACSFASSVLSTMEQLSEKLHSSLSSIDIDLDGLLVGAD